MASIVLIVHHPVVTTDQCCLQFNMASLAEELRLLSLPAPGKINLDEFEDDLTSARVIRKDDIYEDESESEALSKSSLRNKAVVLLADQDKRYAGEAISRKDLLKLRGDLVQDEDLSQEQLSYGKSEIINALFSLKHI